MSDHLPDAVEAIDRAMRADEDCDSRAIVITEQQYHSLAGLQNDVFDTKAGAVYRLFHESMKYRKLKNGVLELEDVRSDDTQAGDGE